MDHKLIVTVNDYLYTDSIDDIQVTVLLICHNVSSIFFRPRIRKSRWSYGMRG